MPMHRPTSMSSRSDASVPGLQEVVVLALAAQRLARAVSMDEITEPLRERLDQWALPVTERKVPQGVASRIAELVRCPVCSGWWISLAVSALWPGRNRLRRGVSVAGAQVSLTLIERLVSESGRGAIHQADITEANSEALDSRPPWAAVSAG